jgi:hypothetical protein
MFLRKVGELQDYTASYPSTISSIVTAVRTSQLATNIYAVYEVLPVVSMNSTVFWL